MRKRATRGYDAAMILFGGVSALLTMLMNPHATEGQSRFLRQPSVSATQIAFVHANDIWVVGREGGDAWRLTSADGAETEPAFSPDGQWIAFTGEYGGNQDVYLVAATGGQPLRLTWHPSADVVQGWTPEGDILFRSGREGVPTRLWTFYTVGVEGGLPERSQLHQAYQGEMSDDGEYYAYQEIQLWDPGWRNYRGGQAQPIRVVSTSTLDLEHPSWEGERHLDPTWMDGTVYFMSERDWASNVWSYDPDSGQDRQLTFHNDFDVMSLDAGHGVVVYEQAGYLHELDPASGTTRQLNIRAAGDQNWARARWEDVPPSQLMNPRLSPTGERAVFEHRGDIFTVPIGEGSWRNLTRSSGVADRSPAWSPDGSQIAWFNDASGEYQLVIADQQGREKRTVQIEEPSFYFQPRWSPDGRKLAFSDTHYRVLVMDVGTGEVQYVDTDRYAHPERTMNPVWSPDSRFIAYARRLDTQLRVIIAFDTDTGEKHQLTDGMADAVTPVWDESGDYLYFLASTDYGLNTGWLDMTSYDRPVTRALYVAVLAEGGASPFLPLSDEEQGGDADVRSGHDIDGSVTLDPQGISRRIVGAPNFPLRNYTGLLPGPSGHVFITESAPNEDGLTLHRYSLDDRKSTQYVTGVANSGRAGFATATVSSDRSKILHRSGSTWRVTETSDTPPSGTDGRLMLSDLRIRIEPTEEWSQMLRDGWRFMRDFLYVDNQHGAPWSDVWDWYSEWLPDLQHRSDFNHLLDMLSGEIAVGHSYVRGGDYPELTNPRTGLLGADLSVVDSRYRIDRIYSGESWNPQLRGPLSHPGLGVSEGDFIIAIDGRSLTASKNPFEFLEGAAGRTVALTISKHSDGVSSREIIVVPIENEGQLRNWAWVEGNRQKVHEMSDGRLAYVYLPNTGQGGYTYFNRMYFAQQDRQGAVIDERNNGGGSAADYIIDVMARELTGYFNSRAGDRKPWTQPMAGLFGPKVMIINERAGSGGDLMPYLFRFREVGPLVGTKTWGGLVGTWDTPPLIDGGSFVAPRGGFFDIDGEWAVEAEGVAPDIEVMNTPKDVARGRDPQLEAAVTEALRLLETELVDFKTEPAPPIRYRRPSGR